MTSTMPIDHSVLIYLACGVIHTITRFESQLDALYEKIRKAYSLKDLPKFKTSSVSENTVLRIAL